ncbi:ATP-binding cassette domain-containing protein [Leucobacter sp.]
MTADQLGSFTLSAESLSYSYGDHPALRNFSARFERGVTGLVGPNGAGKSTLLRLLAGTESAQSGQLDFDGARVVGRRERARYRADVGYVPQDPEWIGEFTVRDLLEYFAVLRCGRGEETHSKINRVLETLDLTGLQSVRLSRLSGGQNRRAFLGQALVHEPPVLILDEPTAGLDPVQRAQFRRYLSTVAAHRIVVVSTHLVEDVAHIADTIQVLRGGRGVWSGAPALLEELGGKASGIAASAVERGLLQVLDQDGASA